MKHDEEFFRFTRDRVRMTAAAVSEALTPDQAAGLFFDVGVELLTERLGRRVTVAALRRRADELEQGASRAAH